MSSVVNTQINADKHRLEITIFLSVQICVNLPALLNIFSPFNRGVPNINFAFLPSLAFRFFCLILNKGFKKMINFLIDTFIAVCAVMLIGYMIRYQLRRIHESNKADQIPVDDYLLKITQATGISAYDTFCKSAENWRVSAATIDHDFKIYLASQTVPYYVKDFIRKNKKSIDELFRIKGISITDKRQVLFHSLLPLLFWGGTVFLSLYVFPHIWP